MFNWLFESNRNTIQVDRERELFIQNFDPHELPKDHSFLTAGTYHLQQQTRLNKTRSYLKHLTSYLTRRGPPVSSLKDSFGNLKEQQYYDLNVSKIIVDLDIESIRVQKRIIRKLERKELSDKLKDKKFVSDKSIKQKILRNPTSTELNPFISHESGESNGIGKSKNQNMGTSNTVSNVKPDNLQKNVPATENIFNTMESLDALFYRNDKILRSQSENQTLKRNRTSWKKGKVKSINSEFSPVKTRANTHLFIEKKTPVKIEIPVAELSDIENRDKRVSDPEIDSITDIVSSYLDNEEISALEPLISDRFDIIKTPEKLKEARTPISKKSLIKEFTTPKLEQIPRFKQQFESVSLPDSLHSDITPDKSVVFMDFESHTNSDRLFIKSSSSLNISFRSISKRLSLTDMAKASSTHNLTINSGSRDSTFITPPLETIRRDSFAYQRYRSHLEKDKNSEKDRKYSYL